MANGSRRSSPTPPVAAAVFSEPMVAATSTPCCHECDSNTSGTVVARRPPKRNAEIGTPFGSCHSGAIDGHCDAGTQKRELGCAAGWDESPGVHDCPFQSVRCAGGSSVRSSHHTSPSSVSAVLVNTVLASIVRIALGFDFSLVPGATPKNPN